MKNLFERIHFSMTLCLNTGSNAEKAEMENSMNEDLIGCFARSLAGHDKCAVYVIVNFDHEYVYLCDGKNRLVDGPKKKKRKHVQLIKQKDSNIESKLNENIHLIDEDIKRAIKFYISNN